MNRSASVNKGLYLGASAVVVIGALAVAVATRLWFLTALPIGVLFGFFLQKGDLCGASAFSEVLLMRDWRKMWGLWVCIVSGMAGFAVLERLGWIALSPKPLLWASALVGGAVFGVGMVLAGGCISGCLFKSGTGNLNSMVALLGIALGVALVEQGPLNGLHKSMMALVVKAPGGGAVTLSSLTGMPFWALTIAFVVLTVAAAFWIGRRGRRPVAAQSREPFSFMKLLTARSWKPWQAGLAIGLLGGAAYLSSAATGRNYPLGVTHGVLFAQLLLTDSPLVHVYKKPAAPASATPTPTPATPSAPQPKKVSWWLILLVVGVVFGSWVSGRLSGEARLLPKPPEQTVTAFFGGLLVGVGAGFASGCVIGNIMSGWALMSVGMILFGVATILANWVTTYFYLMGGSLRDLGAGVRG